MKLFVLLILLFFGNNTFSQSKKLNTLLQKYPYCPYGEGLKDLLKAFPNYKPNKQLPFALQDTKELIIPPYLSFFPLTIMKWRDVDSIDIFDRRDGSVIIDLFGIVTNYKKLEPGDTFNALFLDTLNCAVSFGERTRIVLSSKTPDEKLSHSRKFRKQLRKVFYQLNHSRVVSHYRFKWHEPISADTIVVNYRNKRVDISRSDYGRRNTFFLTADDVKQVEKIRINFTNYRAKKLKFEVVSFILYISGKKPLVTVINKGAMFNEETIRALKNVQTGEFLTFVNVKTKGKDGIRTVDEFTIMIR